MLKAKRYGVRISNNMNEKPDDQPGEKREVNLQKIAQEFMLGMQRHFDMLAFNLSSKQMADEERYKQIAKAPNIMPAAFAHQNFEQMQAYARDLMVRQLVNDALNLVVTVLNNTHFFLSLVKSSNGNNTLTPESQKVAQTMHEAFVKMQLDQRFDALEKDFSILCDLEDTVTSLGFCLQALMQQGGIVKEPQLDMSGKLILDLKAVEKGDAMDPAATIAGSHLTDYSKVFKEGETIIFSDAELQLILLTITAFGDNLFKSTAKYVQSVKGVG